MRLVLREDLGGILGQLPYLSALSDIQITKPFVIFKGPNGCGKSAILHGMRAATQRFGIHFGDIQRERLGPGHQLSPIWGKQGWDEIDLAMHATVRSEDRWSRTSKLTIPAGSPGAFDTRAMLWSGQESFFFSGRYDYQGDSSYDLPRRRQMSEDNMRSHGEKVAGELNYALAWGLGLIDTPDAKKQGHESDDLRTIKEVVSKYLEGAPKTAERWLFLDEPETGVDERRLAGIFSLLAENCEVGKLRTFCATHSVLADELSLHPMVQIIDVREMMPEGDYMTPDLTKADTVKNLSRFALAEIRKDLKVAMKSKEHAGQGRFTIHDRRSIPPRHTDMEPYGTTTRKVVKEYVPREGER